MSILDVKYICCSCGHVDIIDYHSWVLIGGGCPGLCDTCGCICWLKVDDGDVFMTDEDDA